MALYHFHVTQVKRSAGSSVIEAAAYRAGERLYSDYYGMVSDYTRKGGVICSEILLPSHAPPEYADRQTLWNAVENTERNKNAQLAYSFDIALQNELSLSENIALARQFLLEQFVSRGMIVDFAVHKPDKKNGGIPNPHFHVLCPIRPLKADGKWDAKQHRVYRLDEYGNHILDKHGKPVFDAVPTTDWGKPETLLHWRKEWANCVNQAFEKKGLTCRVDHRSLEEQGIQRIPTIHEGQTVRALEKKGISTNKGEFNRWTKITDATLRKLRAKVKYLLGLLKELKVQLSAPQEPTLADYLNAYYDERNAGAWSNKAKVNNLKQYAAVFDFLAKRKLITFDDLIAFTEERDQALREWNDWRKTTEAQIKNLDKLIAAGKSYLKNKPVMDEFHSIKFTKRREAYRAAHDAEITAFYAARRKLDGQFDESGELPVEDWKRQRNDMIASHKKAEAIYSRLYQESMELLKIRKCVEDVQQQERTQERQQHQER